MFSKVGKLQQSPKCAETQMQTKCIKFNQSLAKLQSKCSRHRELFIFPIMKLEIVWLVSACYKTEYFVGKHFFKGSGDNESLACKCWSNWSKLEQTGETDLGGQMTPMEGCWCIF